MKKLGWDDKRIEKAINYIAISSFFDKYADGLQLEADVTTSVVNREPVRMA